MLEFVVGVALVGAFGYFVYTRVKQGKDENPTEGGGSGGGDPQEPSRPSEQFEK